MTSNNIFNLKTGGASSRTLWGNILFALSLFFILLFLAEVPQDIAAGSNGHIALKEHDLNHSLLLDIRGLLSNYSDYNNFYDIQSELDKLKDDIESGIHRYELAASYNVDLRKNFEDFSLAFKQWGLAESDFLKLYFVTDGSQSESSRDHSLVLKEHESSNLFLKVMQVLDDKEPVIHNDLARGQKAFKTLLWVSGLLMAYIFTVIFYFQRKSSREHLIREKNLEMTLQSIGEAVIATDIHGCITSMNPEAERLTGWRFKDAKDHILSEVFNVVDVHSGMPVNGLVEQVQKEEGIVVLAEDSMLIAANGSRYQIYENGAPIYDDTNKIIGVVLVFRDVTQEYELKNRLSENAMRLQSVVDSSMDAVIVTDEHGMISEWNPAAEKMFGWSYKEVRKKPLHELIIPQEFRKSYQQGIQRLIKDGNASFKAKRIESLALHRDGHTFPVELSMAFMQTDNGWVFNAFIRDLTEQKNNEELILKNNSHLKKSQSMAKLGYWDHDLKTKKAEWSDEYYRILGLSPNSIKPSHEIFIQAVHPDDKELADAAYLESIENKTAYDLVFRIVIEGEARVVHAQGTTTYDENGEPLKSLGVIQDITELKEIEKTLIKQDRLLRKTQHIAKLGYWELNLENGVLEWSDEMFRIFDLDPAASEPSYGLFINAVHPEDRERIDAAYNEFLENNKPYNIIHRIVTNEGIRIVHETCETSFDDEGRPLRSLGMVQDITERKQAEESLQQVNMVIDSSPVVLFRWKATDGWPVEFVSENVRQFGYTAEELVSGDIPFSSIVHPDDFERIVQELEEYSSAGVDLFAQEYRIVSPNGEVYWIDDHTVVERDMDGAIVRYQGIVLDIAKRTANNNGECTVCGNHVRGRELADTVT